MTISPYSGHTAFYIAVDEPAIYRICVAGRIPANWCDRFENMTITTATTADDLVVTTLLGVLADQAALVGMINGLHDVRVAMLRVECLETLPPEDNSFSQ